MGKILTKRQLDKLEDTRHGIKLYSVRELCAMFNISRYSIDNPLNMGELPYISPNNRDRYINLDDFLALCKRKG